MRAAVTRLAILAAVAGAAASLAACGGGKADLANGKAKFVACAGCHALADAGTTATVGPNLDDAFRASRREGFDEDGFRGVIRYWISNPEQRSQPLMPPNLVKGKDADDVAAYIAAVAGTKDAESPVRPAEPIGPSGPGEEGGGTSTQAEAPTP